MGFFDKLKKINIFAGFGSELTDDFYDELEESLILADTGMDVTLELVEELRRRARSEGVKTVEGAREVMVRIIAEALSAGDLALDLSTRPSVVLFIGVNGVGKTTTIGKIGHQLRSARKKVLFCAADTFRAAAADQLTIWAGRAGADIIKQHEGADPAAVVFDAMSAAKARNADVVLVDRSRAISPALRASAITWTMTSRAPSTFFTPWPRTRRRSSSTSSSATSIPESARIRDSSSSS